jgi:hypothetical protein
MLPSMLKGVGSAGAYPVSFETWRPMRDVMSGAPPPMFKIRGAGAEPSTLSLALIIGYSIRLVLGRPSRAWNSRNKPRRVEELPNLESQPLQLRCAGDGAKEVLGGNDTHRHLFFLFVRSLHLSA